MLLQNVKFRQNASIVLFFLLSRTETRLPQEVVHRDHEHLPDGHPAAVRICRHPPLHGHPGEHQAQRRTTGQADTELVGVKVARCQGCCEYWIHFHNL